VRAEELVVMGEVGESGFAGKSKSLISEFSLLAYIL
jgi:hypothetical protein